MKMTEYGLKINIEELEKILAELKHNIEYRDMQECIYVDFEKQEITQYCKYAECNSHTIWNKYSR